MSRSLINTLILFLFMFFVFVVFGGKSKAEDTQDTQTLADAIWHVCEDQSGDAQIHCFEYYTNCVINQGLPWQDKYIFNCMKEMNKRSLGK